MSAASKFPIQSTAGAVPVKNEKGELSMQKVKVTRYVAGKRPGYAPSSSDEDDEEEDEFVQEQREPVDILMDRRLKEEYDKAEETDRRLKRLQGRERTDISEVVRERHLEEPEVLATGEDQQSEDEETVHMQRQHYMEESSGDEDEEEVDDAEFDRRRAILRQRIAQKEAQTDLLDVEEEPKSDHDQEEEDESSEYEEYSDSDEEFGARLKPVFVRKSDRVTIQERDKMTLDEVKEEEKKKKIMEERRRTSRKLVEEIIHKEIQAEQGVEKEEDVVITDDENDEEEYEAWKVRELKRIKRDREERELMEKEKIEAERLHNMTEEERLIELKNNPKIVVNKMPKGKYKFLQKYYHRGAFFLNEEDQVYRRDITNPTLEDHFDKTVLPKVMQVKNFGRSGRTKYTHLVDQDTTSFESPWAQENTLNLKFQATHSAAGKQVFEKPSKRRK
ncbi:microfibrillar-associated protein 1-like [Dendronephthya gigantea]|uniref:microfibrillar-associated protein 1-like n=1 Tax=Dendronephthya gigantea TaxID=151771 RepID=UPI00106A2659|nr:microfibrillar-associated protein 1-like [Dendronephthya gigantea]